MQKQQQQTLNNENSKQNKPKIETDEKEDNDALYQ